MEDKERPLNRELLEELKRMAMVKAEGLTEGQVWHTYHRRPKASDALVEECTRFCPIENVYGFRILAREDGRKSSPRRPLRNLLMNCLYAMGEATALEILESPGICMESTTREEVAHVLALFSRQRLFVELQKIVELSDIRLGRLFTAEKHWLQVDKRGRPRGLVALLECGVGTDIWNLLVEKAEREGVMELMRSRMVLALLEWKKTKECSVLRVAQNLGLGSHHLLLVHPQSGRSLMHRPDGQETLTFLLEQGLGVHVNLEDSSGITPLDCWIRGAADAEELKALLSAGAVVDSGSCLGGGTALLARNNAKLLQVVVDHGADVTRRKKVGGCLSHWAMLSSSLTRKIIALGFPSEYITCQLLTQGLSTLSSNPELIRDCEDACTSMELLIAHGGDLLGKHDAVLLSAVPACMKERLILAGMELNSTPSLLFQVAGDRSAWSPLLLTDQSSRTPELAVVSNSLAMPPLLMSPLAKAACFGNMDLVRALLDYGVDAGKDLGHVEPLFLSVMTGRQEVSELLLAHGARLSPLSIKTRRLLTFYSSSARDRYDYFCENFVGRNSKRAC